MKSLIAQHIAYSFDPQTPLLSDISAEIKPGTFSAVLGKNGCGKSTFLSCLDGILSPQKGTILLDSANLDNLSAKQRAQSITYVSQHSHAHASTMYDTLLLARKPYLQGKPTESDYHIIDSIIEKFQLEHLALRRIDELSGGEYQKMIIARAFVQEPEILLLDEPTNNLDLFNQLEVLRIVAHEVKNNRLAAICVLHDINLALTYCDTFIFIKDGEVFKTGNEDIVTPELIEAVYGAQCDVIKHNNRKVIIIQ